MKTYHVKVQVAKEDHQCLLDTLTTNRDAFNVVSKICFETKLISRKLLHDKSYYKCRELFPTLPCQYICCAIADVLSAYKTLKTLKRIPLKPAVKKKLAVRLDDCIFTIKNTTLLLSVIGRKFHRITTQLQFYPKVLKLLKDHHLHNPVLFYRSGTFWLAMSFSKPDLQYVENACVGVDLGINRIVATSEGLLISDKRYLKQRRRIRYLKRRLQSRGTRSAKHKLKTLSRKEQNHSKNFVHHVANSLLKTACTTLVFENLKGIKNINNGRKLNNKMSQVPWFLLRNITTYKAPPLGKRVVTVNPAYTSKDDWRGIAPGRRQGCRYYASDGLVWDSDVNAAINIAHRYADRRKLPVSFVPPIDGRFKLNGQAIVNWPIASGSQVQA